MLVILNKGYYMYITDDKQLFSSNSYILVKCLECGVKECNTDSVKHEVDEIIQMISYENREKRDYDRISGETFTYAY